MYFLSWGVKGLKGWEYVLFELASERLTLVPFRYDHAQPLAHARMLPVCRRLGLHRLQQEMRLQQRLLRPLGRNHVRLAVRLREGHVQLGPDHLGQLRLEEAHGLHAQSLDRALHGRGWQQQRCARRLYHVLVDLPVAGMAIMVAEVYGLIVVMVVVIRMVLVVVVMVPMMAIMMMATVMMVMLMMMTMKTTTKMTMNDDDE